MPDQTAIPRWEQFQHGADSGIRGLGATKAQAFEQAALALSGVISVPQEIRALNAVEIHCDSDDDEVLLLDWINAIIFEMSARNMLFGRYQVTLDGPALSATAWGEPVDVPRHSPAVEPKGATFTELRVEQDDAGNWIAQCVVDV